MESVPASRVARRHTNGWTTMLALGLLALALLACLYVLIGFPAEAQAVNGSTVETPSPAYSSPAPTQPYRRPLSSYSSPVVNPNPAPVVSAPAARSEASEALQEELNVVRDELSQSQQNLLAAAREQRRIRTASALFLAVFAVVAALIVLQVYRQARAWDEEANRSVEEV
jgi:hypothetical protein